MSQSIKEDDWLESGKEESKKGKVEVGKNTRRRAEEMRGKK